MASPLLLAPAGSVAAAIGLPELTGLYLVAVAAFLFAALVLIGLSRPRVPVLGRAAAVLGPPSLRGGPPDPPATAGGVVRSLRLGAARTALLVLAAANLVMVAVMAVAPLAITHHGHQLGFVGFAVSLHVLCMFAPSPVTGWLADRAGGATVAALGAALLLVAGGSGVAADLGNGGQALAVLALVGLAWNCGVVGGSALLIAAVPAPDRPLTEGLGEAAMGLAAAVGAPTAGLVIVWGGFGLLGVGGAVVGLATLAALARVLTSRAAAAATPRG